MICFNFFVFSIAFLASTPEIHGFLRYELRIEDDVDTRASAYVEEQFIEQKLNHFDPENPRRWNMRYLSSNEFFREGGPIFIYLGGEWTIHKSQFINSQLYDLASQHNGYLFYTEHRYYGASTDDSNLSDYSYLSVDQALADVIYFIKHIKETVRGLRNSKVVVAGCSYAANMATWIRLKYPHVIDVAYASSGPVKAVADFHQYLEVVGRSIGLASPKCLAIVSEAVSQLEGKVGPVRGKADILKRFNLTVNHQAVSIGLIMNYFALATQYEGLHGLIQACNDIENSSGTALDKVVSLVTKPAKPITNLNWRESLAWTYQTCTEYGFYQTTTSKEQPFGNASPLDSHISRCIEIYGPWFGLDMVQRGVERTNLFYGGQKPQVTKLISVHGSVDPWHPLGILEDLNDLAPAILINGTTHCDDMRLRNRFPDPPQLIAAKWRVRKLISEWIREE